MPYHNSHYHHPPTEQSEYRRIEKERFEKKYESNHNVLPPKKQSAQEMKLTQKVSVSPEIVLTNWDPFQWNRMNERVYRRVMMIIASNLIWKSILCFGDEQSAPISNKLSSYPVQFRVSLWRAMIFVVFFFLRLCRSFDSLCAPAAGILLINIDRSTPIHDTRPIPKIKHTRWHLAWQCTNETKRKRERGRNDKEKNNQEMKVNKCIRIGWMNLPYTVWNDMSLLECLTDQNVHFN